MWDRKGPGRSANLHAQRYDALLHAAVIHLSPISQEGEVSELDEQILYNFFQYPSFPNFIFELSCSVLSLLFSFFFIPM